MKDFLCWILFARNNKGTHAKNIQKVKLKGFQAKNNNKPDKTLKPKKEILCTSKIFSCESSGKIHNSINIILKKTLPVFSL